MALTALGVVLGGIITWVVAYRYFQKQDARAEQLFDALARFLENLAAGPRGASLRFTRDAKGRITNAEVRLIGPTIESGSVLYPPSVSRAEPGDTRAKGGQNDDLMS
jgi:hypothetical protein